jgi:hypothetical protein
MIGCLSPRCIAWSLILGVALYAPGCGGSNDGAAAPERLARLQEVGASASFIASFNVTEMSSPATPIGEITWYHGGDGASRVDVSSKDDSGPKTDTWIHAYGRDIVCSTRIPGSDAGRCMVGSGQPVAAESFEGMNDGSYPESTFEGDGHEKIGGQDSECFRIATARESVTYASRICYTTRGAMTYADGPAGFFMLFILDDHFRTYGIDPAPFLSNQSAVFRAASVRYDVAEDEFAPPFQLSVP